MLVLLFGAVGCNKRSALHHCGCVNMRRNALQLLRPTRAVSLWSATFFQSFIRKLKILPYPVVFSTQMAMSMASSPGTSGIMTIGEVADYLKVTERTIYRLAAAKKIPAFKVGGSWRFSRADIDAWIRQQSLPAEPGEED